MPRALRAVGIVLLLGACSGEATPDPTDTGQSDPAKADDRIPADPAPAACSAEGVPTACDPVANTGCASGDCYVIVNKGPACVCPAGTVPDRQPCNTTRECMPGHGCAGEIAPGTCYAYCDPAAEDPGCPADASCRFITPYPTWGLCLLR